MTTQSATLGRSVRLFRAFLNERKDPQGFYELMARDTVAQLANYTDLNGATVVEAGCGPGFQALELERHGARCVGFDRDLAELTAHGPPPPGCVQGSALDIPVRTDSVDVCMSSNVLEHVPDPWRMADEMLRVVKPGGIVYLSFTNWLSPWGGHETSPWHYLGGHRAARRYQRRTGQPPKNLYGTSLHPVSIGAALAWARGRADAEILDATSRYLPSWTSPVIKVPGLREIVTWNFVLVLRKVR